MSCSEPIIWHTRRGTDNLGRYAKGVVWQLKSLVGKYGDEFKQEINTICTAHTIGFDYTEKKVYYNSCEVNEDGELIIIFSEGNLGTNVDNPLQESNLIPVLNTAPTRDPSDPLSPVARLSLKTDFTPAIDDIQAQVNKIFGQDITLQSNLEENFAALKAAKDASDDWESRFGYCFKAYWEGFIWMMKSKGFESDELLREGFLEVVESATVAFKIAGDSEVKGYNDSVIEDGVYYLRVSVP